MGTLGYWDMDMEIMGYELGHVVAAEARESVIGNVYVCVYIHMYIMYNIHTYMYINRYELTKLYGFLFYGTSLWIDWDISGISIDQVLWILKR